MAALGEPASRALAARDGTTPREEARAEPRVWSSALWLCLLLALVVRLAALLILGHPELRRGDLNLTSDEPSFHLTALAVATTGKYTWGPGGPPTAFRPPGAVLPLAAAYWLVRPTLGVGLAYAMLCGLGVIVAMHRLAYATSGDPRVALVAALLAALMPTLAFANSGVWSEPQAVLLTLILLNLVIRRKGGAGEWAVIGLCASFAYLTRPSAVFVIPFLGMGALLAGGKRVLNTAVLIVVVALPVGLWGTRNASVFGEFLSGATVAGEALWGANNPVTAGTSLPALETKGGFDLYQEAREGRYVGSWVPMQYIPAWAEENPEGTSELDIYHHQMRATVRFLHDQPAVWLRLMGYKLWRLATVESYAPSITGDVGVKRTIHRTLNVIEHWFLFAWGLAGIVQLFRTRNASAWWYACFVLGPLANVLVTYVNPRFLLPLTTVLIPPAALALARSWDAWRGWGKVTAA